MCIFLPSLFVVCPLTPIFHFDELDVPTGGTLEGEARPPSTVHASPYRGTCLWSFYHEQGSALPSLVNNDVESLLSK